MSVLQYGILALSFLKVAQLLEPVDGQTGERICFALSVIAFITGFLLLLMAVAEMP